MPTPVRANGEVSNERWSWSGNAYPDIVQMDARKSFVFSHG